MQQLFTVSELSQSPEERPLNARSKSARSVLVAIIGAAVALTATAPATLAAQDLAKNRISVATFASRDKSLGCKAADALRSRLAKQWSPRDVYVLPTKDIQNTLEQSGFGACDPLSANDEKALANLVRADEYVTGRVTSTPNGFDVDAKLVLARDASLAQSLPEVVNKDLNGAMDAVARSVKDAMRQLAGEQACINKARANDIAGALASAREGTAAYPRATLSRLCAANIFYAQYAKATSRADSMRLADSVLAVTRQIMQNDSTSVAALRLQAELYKVRGDSARARQALVGLIRADPGNQQLLTQVVNELAASGHAQEAVPLVKDLLQRNPGDPQLTRTAFLVFLAAQDWQDAVATGPLLVQADTAAADSLYFVRMAAAYTSLNQPQQALTLLQQGTARFPNNATLWLATASAYGKAGQQQQSVAALRRALTLNPRVENGSLLLANAYAQMSMPDSVLAVLQRASTQPGVDRQTLAQFALAQGSNAFKAANASKSRADYQRALALLQLSNRIAPSVDAQFLIGATSFSIGQSAATEANESKSCTLAQLARQSFADAETGLRAGTGNPQYQAAAQQYLQYIPQFGPAVRSQIQRFCR